MTESKLEIKGGKRRKNSRSPSLKSKNQTEILRNGRTLSGHTMFAIPEIWIICPSDQTPALPNGFGPVPRYLPWSCCHRWAARPTPQRGAVGLAQGSASSRLLAAPLPGHHQGSGLSPPHHAGGPPQTVRPSPTWGHSRLLATCVWQESPSALCSQRGTQS